MFFAENSQLWLPKFPVPLRREILGKALNLLPERAVPVNFLVSREWGLRQVRWRLRPPSSVQRKHCRFCTHSKYDTVTPPALARMSGIAVMPRRAKISSPSVRWLLRRGLSSASKCQRKWPDQPLDRRSGYPRGRQPSAPRVGLAGRPEKREYSRQFGSHPGNPGLNYSAAPPYHFRLSCARFRLCPGPAARPVIGWNWSVTIGPLGRSLQTPIRYVNRAHSRTALVGLYRSAHAALVTPLRDGMNLVAKEYVAARRPRGRRFCRDLRAWPWNAKQHYSSIRTILNWLGLLLRRRCRCRWRSAALVTMLRSRCWRKTMSNLGESGF